MFNRDNLGFSQNSCSDRKKKKPNPLKGVSKKSNEVLRSYQEMGAAVMEIFLPAAV